MEGTTLSAAARLAGIARDHPEVSICRVDGVYHATVHLDRGFGEMHAEDEAELLAKLTAALGA